MMNPPVLVETLCKYPDIQMHLRTLSVCEKWGVWYARMGSVVCENGECGMREWGVSYARMGSVVCEKWGSELWAIEVHVLLLLSYTCITISMFLALIRGGMISMISLSNFICRYM